MSHFKMRRTPATLLIDHHHWRLLQPARDEAPSLEMPWSASEVVLAAEQISEMLSELAPKTRRVAVLLDASLCLTASFQMDSPKHARKREALLYKLEEQIPVAAEDVVADFLRRGSQIFAVAVERHRLVPLIDALGDRGVQIELISPAAALAWEQHISLSKHADQEAVAWLNQDQTGDLTIFRSGQPVSWTRIKAGDHSLNQQLTYERISAGKDLPLIVYSKKDDTAADDLTCRFSNAELRYCGQAEEPLRQCAMKTLFSIRAGQIRPILDLTEGLSGVKSSRHPLERDFWFLQLAVLFLLGLVLLSNVLESRNYGNAVNRIVVAQEDVFRRVFSGSRLQRGVLSRLQGEFSKLDGARGKTDDIVADESVMPMIHSFLKALPEEMRFRLVDIKIEDRDLDLTGEVRDFADADRIAVSLRVAGFEVKPPTTRRLAEAGIGFRLQAKFVQQPRTVDYLQ